MKHDKIRIDSCRVCASSDFQSILSLGDLHLSDFIDTHDLPPQYPLNLLLCKSCNLVQLEHNIPSTELYTENYGYRSGINKTMQKELKTIVQKALKKQPDFPKDGIFIDIGANDGTLLRFVPKKYTRVAFEPIKKLAKDAQQHASIVINDFFNYAAYKKQLGDKKAKIITAISCFYDMEEPNTFVKDITKILDQDGIFIIQQNYVVGMLEQNAFDNIVHEHLEYYSLLSLEKLLERHNLEVFDVELTDINGGSFRTYIAFKGKKKVAKRVLSMRKKEEAMGLHMKNVYKNFAKEVKATMKSLTDFIKQERKKGKNVYVYGASTRGNTLLQYAGLNNKLITAAVERNPEKWGKKIASVGVPIISEDQARKEKPDYMLVLPWFFKEEFLTREKKYLDQGGKFIFPLPKFEVIKGK